ncbi:MAG TPA: DUF192 domain-containing protein [Miltoncostaeaceae bacterium]|nr:DUF192 domain-containing protein [Miltoncostaeaceae bacterium]
MGRLRIDRLHGAPLRLTACGRGVAVRCHLADRPLGRLVGLLGTRDLGGEEALWIDRCAAVHTAFLRAPIGVAFVDGDGRVLTVVDPLPRNRAAAHRGARAAVECRAGVLNAAGVRPGCVLTRAAAGNSRSERTNRTREGGDPAPSRASCPHHAAPPGRPHRAAGGG